MAIQGIRTYTHRQNVSRLTWTVSHNLNTDRVAVNCAINFNSQLEKALPVSIVIVDENTLEVNWSQPRTGVVSVVGMKYKQKIH